MPKFRVEALEKFLVRTVYHVEADTMDVAMELCRTGKVAYDEHVVEEGGDEWLYVLDAILEGEKAQCHHGVRLTRQH